MLERARIRDDAEALRLQVVDDVLELGLAEQIVGQALLEAHAEVVGDLRTLQVEVDEEHPGVHVLRQRQREVDRGHASCPRPPTCRRPRCEFHLCMSRRRSTRVRRILKARSAATSETAGRMHWRSMARASTLAWLEAPRLLQVGGRRGSRGARAAADSPTRWRSGRSVARRSAKFRRIASSMVVLIDGVSHWVQR